MYKMYIEVELKIHKCKINPAKVILSLNWPIFKHLQRRIFFVRNGYGFWSEKVNKSQFNK